MDAWELRPDDTALRWFARRHLDGIAGGIIKSRRGLSRLLANLNGQADLYWNINPSSKRVGVRVAASDITHWSSVLLDIDPVEPDAKPLQAAMIYLAAARALVQSDLQPTIIDSGRGVQIVLHLTPQALNEHSRCQVRRAVRSFLKGVMIDAGPAPILGCKLDLSCSDLARVARMPQTINLKTKRWTCVVSTGVTASQSISERLLALAGPAIDEQPYEQEAKDGLKWQQVWSHLTRSAQNFIEEGASQGDRHRMCVATARSLRQNGVPKENAIVPLRGGCKRCDPELAWPEALRILNQTY